MTRSFEARAALVTRDHYASVTRYTTSAFMRLKLGDRLHDRGRAPHVFETLDEAMADRAA